MRHLLLLPAAMLLVGNTDMQDIPPTIRAMLEDAMRTGNDSDVSTVVKYARRAAPDAARQIADIAADWRKQRSKARTERLQHSDFFELVTGKVQLGGFYTTGNTQNIGLTGTIDIKREGYKWRHKLHLMADYQKSAGITSREHYIASYEPNYKIDDRAYIYGALQYESDRFLGYYDRYSTSTGIGYSVVKKPTMTLDLELGPAYRYTNFTDDSVESNIAGRGSLAFKWDVSPAITFHQDASAYLQSDNSTATARSALSAKLFGPVSGQISYQIQYESLPNAGQVSTDTTSRASVVYDF